MAPPTLPARVLSCCLVSATPAPDALEAIAHACSPRVERHGTRAVIFDAAGLARAIGSPADIAREVQRLSQGRGLDVRIALAATSTAAWLLAHARPGITVAPADAAAAVRELSIDTLAVLELGLGSPAIASVPEGLRILARWGLVTLGDLARLPRADVHARLGPLGVRWHQAACGEAIALFVPDGETPRFVERLELEWPIDGLEPLSFVLARLCEALSASLERADRGAVDVLLRLRLVTRAMHARTLHLPAPMRDARVLRTLILLDLESHPPDAAIDWVEVEAAVAPGAILQGSLLSRTLPSAEDLATLVARLRALAGESRVGAPALVDTHDDRAVALAEFRVPAHVAHKRHDARGRDGETSGAQPASAFRRFRLPIAARVVVADGAPVRVDPSARGLVGGRVLACAGPWRSSGAWWTFDGAQWDREAWDVEVAGGGIYRLARDRATRHWVIEGLVD